MLSLPSAEAYRRHLLEDILPFWMRHAIDRRHGGLFTCLRDDGALISRDKYVWSQGRAVWTFAAAYNHVERNEEFLDVAERAAEFLLRHGRDAVGRYCYRLGESGEMKEGPTSIYSDCFAAYGLAELFRATGREDCLAEALRIMGQTSVRIRHPDFNDLAPYSRPPGVAKVHGVAMIVLETAQEVARNAPENETLRQLCADALAQILRDHVRWDEGCVLEHLAADGRPVDSPAGRAINPGHAIESMWFVIHHSLRSGDHALARRACEVIRWHLEKGWDAECGGLFLAIDAGGEMCWWPHAEKKIWWPHTEAIYALHLARALTGASWCAEWLEKILRYSLEKFPDPVHGEWRQRLDREGRPISEVVALPVKDPFHLPRMLIRTWQLLENPPPLLATAD